MSSERHYRYVSASPSYPGLTMDNSSSQWEENYRRRARLMTRDYVNPNSTRLDHQRSRSADSRPQYRTRTYNHETPEIRATSSDLSSHRAQCLNMFYPTTDESRARVMYNTGGPQFPSQLPRPVGVYESSDLERSGRSLSPASYSGSSYGRGGSRTHKTPSGIVDPYATSQHMRRPAPQFQNSSSAPVTPKRHDYDYLKHSLIMFGEEESSMGTGLSQQELLERKRREQTTARRREKKQRKRIVNLPSSLFPPHSSRQRQLNSSRDRDQDNYHYDLSRNRQASPVTIDEYEPPSPHLASQMSSAPSTPRHAFSGPTTNTTHAVSPDPPADRAPEALSSMGSRGSMVNRIKNQKSSTGRRWKIIPSLSRSRSRSRSPIRTRSADEIDETGAFPSPARVVGSVRYGDPNKKKPTNNNVRDTSKERADNDSSSDYTPKRALDPPGGASNVSDDYSDEEMYTWTGTEQPMEQSSDMDDGNDQRGNFISYGQDEQWNDPRVAGPTWKDFGEDGRDRGFPDPQSRLYYGSKSAQNTPRKYNKNGAFPEFSSPATPMTASMTNDSNEMPYEFDPFTTPMVDYSDDVQEEHPYSKRSQQFSNFEDTFWRSHPETPSGRREGNAEVPAAYMPMSRLNNPPGLDMDFYSRPKPDAPASNSNSRHTKMSPTSIYDMNQNVRWSENLDQLPTPRRMTNEKPKSILKRSRLRRAAFGNDYPSDETPAMNKAVRISDKPASRGQFISEHPSAMGFVDIDGRSLSPITSFDAEYGDHGWPANQATPIFERNIPEEFQLAFLTENAISKTDGNSGQMSVAYAEFIESVASVVVQTAARQFLAKLRVRRLREKRNWSRRLSKQTGMKKADARTRNHHTSTRNDTGVQLDMFTLAAIRIQAVYRGWYARDCISIDNYCATIIQKNFRRKKPYSLFRNCVYCVVKIQSAFRAYRVRETLATSNHEPSEVIYHMAATVIQSQWRCFMCEMDFLRAYEDILLVQSIARGWVARSRFRSWLRKHNIQTSWLTKENDTPRKKSTSSQAYTLPHGYHNHTAFMKQSLPSPVRNTHATKSKQQIPEKAEYSSSDSTQYPEISIDSSRDGLIEMYHNTQDEKNTESVNSSTKSMQLRSADSSSPFDEQDRDSKANGEDVNVSVKARNNKFGHARARIVTSSSHDEIGRDQETGALRSIQHGALVSGKKARPVVGYAASFDLATKKTTTSVASQISSFGNKSEEMPDSAPDGGSGTPAAPQIDESNLATASSVLAGWRNREKNGKSFGQGRTPARQAVASSGSFDLATETTTGATKFQVRAVGIESAAMVEPKTDVVDINSESKEHATASKVLAGWHNREVKGSSFRKKGNESTHSFGSSSVSSYPDSFNLASKKAADVTTPQVESTEKEDEAPSERRADDLGSSSEAKEHATASSVLAGWRNREKKGNTNVGQVNISATNPSFGNLKKPVWLTKNSDEEEEHLPDGSREDTTSNDAPKWQKRGPTISVSKSFHESHALPRATGKNLDRSEDSNDKQSLAMKLRPVSHDLHDEKKEDMSVSGATARTVSQPPELQPESDQSAGLDDDSAPAMTAPVNKSDTVVEKGGARDESLPLGDPMKSKSPIHMELRKKRSESEQKRIDAMHHMFIRAGVMGRAEKEKISFADTTSAEYEGRRMQQEGDFEPTASDLLHAWKGVDQTQPEMRGKLF